VTIKIVLAEGEGAKSGYGARVYTETGHEIVGVTAIDISIRPDTAVFATLEVLVSQIENLEAIGIFVAREEPEE
jgi:hypothetical protein